MGMGLKTDLRKLRVLHVGNVAHIAEVLATYTDKFYGTESVVLERGGSSPYLFALKALLKARNFNIVHIHYADSLLPWFRRVYPHKKLVMHYHGDDIRRKWKQKQNRWKHANVILYSTSDLEDAETPENAVHLPNTVDTELFRPYWPYRARQAKSALTFTHYADDLAKELANQHNLALTIMQRTVAYAEMPFVLSNYEYYVEVKRNFEGILLDSLSVTGLQALACGLKVVKWDGQVIEGLPEVNKPEHVISNLYSLYTCGNGV
jgi:hypothetical protein